MINRKATKKYYFSVEGETEKWYLEWLRERINECKKSAFNVSFNVSVQKNSLKRAKSLTVTGRTEIWHLSDYESDAPVHVTQFTDTIDSMKAVKDLGKQITYKYGYTNIRILFCHIFEVLRFLPTACRQSRSDFQMRHATWQVRRSRACRFHLALLRQHRGQERRLRYRLRIHLQKRGDKALPDDRVLQQLNY